MTQDAADQAKRLIIGEYVEWVKRFDINDYVKNRPMIEKLYEEKQLALARSFQLEEKVQKLEIHIHDLELKNQKLTLNIHETSRKSTVTFLLSLVATVLVGVGVNIATSTPYGWTGWIMVFVACILQVIAFLSMPKEDKK